MRKRQRDDQLTADNRCFAFGYDFGIGLNEKIEQLCLKGKKTMKNKIFVLLLLMAAMNICGCSNGGKNGVQSDSASDSATSAISETSSSVSTEAAESPSGNADNESDFEYREKKDGTIKIKQYIGNESEIVIPAVIDGKSVLELQSIFDDCTDLPISVTVSDGIEKLAYTFENCSKLKSVSLPNSLTGISINTFKSCEDLESITIPESVTYLGNYAFAACFKLKTIVIPDSVTEIGTDLFNSCTSLESVTLSANITEIPDFTFAFCSSLKRVDIPEGVTTIGDGAFYECTSLQRVSLPDSLIEFDITTFTGCKDLVLTYKGEEYPDARRGELYYALKDAQQS